MINLVQAAQKSALHLQSIMEYRLTEIPLSLFHLNGTMKKAQKSKLLDCFSFNVPHEVGNHVSIIDMGLLWRISLPSKEDREIFYMEGLCRKNVFEDNGSTAKCF